METLFQNAAHLLREFKGDSYIFGMNCLDRFGELFKEMGTRPLIVSGGFGKEWSRHAIQAIGAGLSSLNIQMAGPAVPGTAPNAPRGDVLRIRGDILRLKPDSIIAAGSGSTIDAVKCAAVMAQLHTGQDDFESLFGAGKVTKQLADKNKNMLPLFAIQFAASSAAHLTKYSNITDPSTAQKKLIVDDAVVPPRALFDYSMTFSQPVELTADGALDGIAHSLEVLYGACGSVLKRVTPVALASIELIVRNIKTACDHPQDCRAREGLGLGTDLGGYAIMIGGTNGGHLTSFSLVDILSHGRACAILNPYYTVFFAPAIEDRLRKVGDIFRRAGYTSADFNRLKGRDLGVAAAEAMHALSRDIGFPTRLRDVPGFSSTQVERALSAAGNPQLDMKLKAMPVPMSAETVDRYMAPILHAAAEGDFSLIQMQE